MADKYPKMLWEATKGIVTPFESVDEAQKQRLVHPVDCSRMVASRRSQGRDNVGSDDGGP